MSPSILEHLRHFLQGFSQGQREKVIGLTCMEQQELENVFAPFRRLEGSRNRETGGTGLGLPIARNILRAHGGDVVLRNRRGGGLAALVTLPV